MKTTVKRWLPAVLAMALLTATLWPQAVSGQQAVQDNPKDRERPRARMLAKDLLNLTPEQEKALQQFGEARRKDLRAFRDQMTKTRTDMRVLMKDPKANEAKIDGLIDQTYKLRAEHAKIAFRERREMEKILTPEQLDKMRKYRGLFGGFMGRPWFRGQGRFGFHGRGMGRYMGFGVRGQWLYDRGWDRR